MIRASVRVAALVLLLAPSIASGQSGLRSPEASQRLGPSSNEIAAPLPIAPRPVNDTVGVTDPFKVRPTAEGRGLHELSPLSMFLAADVVVKAVMIGLMAASLATWTIFVGKTLELYLARRRLLAALAWIAGATGVRDAERALGPVDNLVVDLLGAARDELALSAQATTKTGLRERVDSRFADVVRSELQNMRRGMGMLATIGSVSPFVGLFGTVWGIMNSFIGISKSQTTNLAVVAPGIAEALLATAIGLVAAIPAVIIYNHFSRGTRAYGLLVTRAAGTVTRLLSRDLDGVRPSVTRAAE